MRITQNMIHQAALTSLQGNQRQMAQAHLRVSTQLRFQKASEDPSAAYGTMQAGGSLRALEQYRRNVQAAEARTHTEESALDQLTELMVRARELGLSQAGSLGSEATRAAAKAEVDQLIEHTVQLGNTRFAGGYLFGGNQADAPPIVRDGDGRPQVNGDIAAEYTQRTEIAGGQYLKVTHNAQEVFGGAASTLDALWQLSQALESGDTDAIKAATNLAADASDHIQTLIGAVGARSNQLGVTAANLDALEINLRTFKADLEEVDLEQAILELLGRQDAYQAAMLATSRVMGMTLVDYLR